MEILFGLMIGVFLISTLVGIFYIVCMWRIYTRCGLPGWKALIPFYSVYALAEAIGMPVIGVIIILLSLLAGIGSSLAFFFTSLPLLLIMPLACVGVVILSAVLWWNVCPAIGFQPYVSLLVVFVPIIGYPILAFAKN